VASQDFQVKTVSSRAGGAIRDNYKTCFYVGGDRTTAEVLLDKAVEPDIEATLGKGLVMLRCAAVKPASLARTRFTDNQALYTLLGPSSYQPSYDDEDEDEESLYQEFEDDDDDPLKEVEPHTEKIEVASIAPIIPDKGPKAADVDINILCACWNGGANSVSKLETLFNMSHREAYKAYQRIMAQRKQPVEEQE
jgi:hypothetical protein